MRIAIDIDEMRGRKTGIGYYTKNLIKGLAEIDHNNEYLLYVYFFRSLGANIEKDSMPKQDNFIFRPKRIPRKIVNFLFSNIGIPIESLFGQIDILHSVDHTLPPIRSAKSVATIHDLTLLLFPEYITKSFHMYMRSRLLSVTKRADKIIAVSNSSKNDIARLLGVPPEKINVIYEAASDKFQIVKDTALLEAVKRKHNLEQKFILYVGTLEARKNIPFLIKAFKLLKEIGGVKHKLVIAGKKGRQFENVFQAVRKLDLKDEVIFTDYVPEEDLPALYSCADLFVFPSLYEGFGIPPLEAMLCGVPVICSNVSSLPEVVGDAGILIDPHDKKVLSEMMYRVLTDLNLRRQLIEKGFKRAGLFSWQRAAKETLGVYEALYRS